MIYDSIVVGHGPAGLTASIYLKRANKNVISIGKDFGVLSNPHIKIENYFGYKNTPGINIVKEAFEHAKELGCEIITDEVVSIDCDDNFFEVTTVNNKFKGLTLILATGQKRATLRIEGLNRFAGKGISYCATCDGFFYRNKKIALIGHSKYMLQELKDLSSITNDITIFTNGETLNDPVHYPVITDRIIKFIGEESIEAIETQSGSYTIDGVFIAYGVAGGLDIARKLGVLIEDNDIIVNHNNETNISGLFAAGDITKGRKQITKASYDGMIAAHGVIEYLYRRKEK